MKKLIYALFLGALLTSSAAANASDNAKSRVILDELLTGKVPALNASQLNIPDDLSPGFHEIKVEVYNKNGVVSSETALFCKDNKGVLHFDNKCPDLLQKPKPAPIRFNPYKNPNNTINFYVLLISLFAFLIGVGNQSSESADLSGVESGELTIGKKQLGWGDRRKYLRFKIFNSLDHAPISLAKQVEKVSSLVARVILDARYLRVIFANISWLTIPTSIFFCFEGLHQNKNQALPFSFSLTLILMLIGLFDALAGLSAAILFLNFVFANGHLNSKNSILFSLGYSLLFFAPGLLASKFRPLHRYLKSDEDWWVRLTDYVLAALLTGFASAGLIKSLTGQFGYELKIASYANRFGIYIGLAVIVRMFIEEFAWHLYPKRVRELHYELKSAGVWRKLRGLIFKIGFAIYFAYPYIGWNRYMAIGMAILFAPNIISFLGKWLPKTGAINHLIPKGAVRFTLLGVSGIYLTIFLNHKNYSPEDLVLTSFILLPIPAAILSFYDNFNNAERFKIKPGRKYSHKVTYKYFFRVMSVFVLIFIAILLSGHNPLSEIHRAWANPSITWHSLSYKWWPSIVRDWHISAKWINKYFFISWHFIRDHYIKFVNSL